MGFKSRASAAVLNKSVDLLRGSALFEDIKMILIFRRTGQRRYAVEVKRPPHPDVEMNPAPGYDALMPHDLMHLVVEAQLGLTHGIFGQLAAGGDAGTFHLIMKQEWPSRTGARIRRRLKTKGTALLR